MQHIHGRRIAILDLDGLDVKLVFMMKHIDEDLGGIQDRIRAVERMVIAVQCEIGHGFHIKEIRAGEPEEIAQHLIAVPVVGQVRQTVKYIISAPPIGFDDLINNLNFSLNLGGGMLININRFSFSIQVQICPGINDVFTAGKVELEGIGQIELEEMEVRMRGVQICTGILYTIGMR